MNYVGKKLKNQKYQNTALVFTSDGYLLEPFYGRGYSMPFDWGISSFASVHLAITILAHFYKIDKNDSGFPQGMKDIIFEFHDFFVKNFEQESWLIESEEISEWLETQLPELNETLDEEIDNRIINLTVAYTLEPSTKEQS